jgi:hypothetical protein|tara:strand:+ start:83 stop:847 length:765 start_codon:yes stop_codon:yes gene_type:complete
MALPTSGYPATLDDTSATPSGTVEFPQPASSTDLDATNVEHDKLHTNLSLAIVALETKLGITDSNATAGTLLKGTGSGSSEWSSVLPSVTFGTDGSGVDVTFYSATAGDNMLWDASDEKLVITGTNGQNALEVADGDVEITDALTVTGTTTTYLNVITDSGTTRTPALTDAGAYILCTHGSGMTVTLPQDSAVAFPIGTHIIFERNGAGTLTFAAGTGATVNSKGGTLTCADRYTTIACVKIAANTWTIFGNIG